MVRTRFSPGRLALWLAGFLALLFLLPGLTQLVRSHFACAIRQNHGEGISLSTYGKWWFSGPHRFLVDAFSGDFATFYNYVPDSMLGLLGKLTGVAPMVLQAVVVPPVMGFAFAYLNFWAANVIVGDAWVALLASAFIAFTGNSGLASLYDLGFSNHLTLQLHVPFHALPLVTAQSMGWVFFLPMLALLYRAFTAAPGRRTTRDAIWAGVMLGLLFQVHTLTFLQIFVTELAFVTLLEARDAKRPWLVGWLAIVGAFVYIAATRDLFPLSTFLALSILGFACNFLFSEQKKTYLICFGPAALVALPYVMKILPFLKAGLGDESHNPEHISVYGVVIFFLPSIVLSFVAVRRAWRSRLLVEPSFLMIGALLGGGILMGANDFWNLHNHPYRFEINLIYPFAMLAAYAIVHARGRLTSVFAVWLGLGALLNAGHSLTGGRPYFHVGALAKDETEFLEKLREVTRAAEPGDRFINPPEFRYPQGVVQSSILVNYSAIPGFIPDYRYIGDLPGYYERMATFCSLFPEYPAYDIHLLRRACQEKFGTAPTNEELHAQKIRYAAAFGEPFYSTLMRTAQARGWTTLSDASRAHALLVEIPATTKLSTGLLRISRELRADSSRVTYP